MGDQFQATICSNTTRSGNTSTTVNGGFDSMISCSTELNWPSPAADVIESKSTMSSVPSLSSASNSSSVVLHDIPLYSSDPMLDFSSLLSPTVNWSQPFMSCENQADENNISAPYYYQQIQSNKILQNSLTGNSLSNLNEGVLHNDQFRRNNMGSLTSEQMLYGLLEPNSNKVQLGYYEDNQAQIKSHIMRPNSVNKFVKASDSKHQLQFSNETTFWNPLDTMPSELHQSDISTYANINNHSIKESSTISDKKIVSEPALKKQRTVQKPFPLPTFKVRKENLGNRINALQQLVSPFGKTDTASVLHESIDYIKFLHDQVRDLSAPYFSNGYQVQHVKSLDMRKDYEGNKEDLRSRGLCLVPIPSTYPVNNEALPVDHLWTPSFGSNYMLNLMKGM